MQNLPLAICSIFLAFGCYEPKLDQPPPGGEPKAESQGAAIERQSVAAASLLKVPWKSGISPYQRSEKMNLAKTAVVVVAMQQAFTGSQSKGMAAGIIPNVNRIIQSARAAGLPIVFTQQGARTEAEQKNEINRWWGKTMGPGVDGFDLDPSLSRTGQDPVMVGPHYSAFAETGLKETLAGLGVEDVILLGTATNVQVESTARDAFSLGLRVFVSADATAAPEYSLQLASLRNLAFGFAIIVDTKQVVSDIDEEAKRSGGTIRSPAAIPAPAASPLPGDGGPKTK